MSGAVVDPDRRARDIRFIHAAARELGMDRAAYEDMLFTQTRCRSCKDMDFTGLARVKDHLRKCGAGRKATGARAALAAEWAWIAGHKEERTLRALAHACERAGLAPGGQVAYCNAMLTQRRGAAQPLQFCDWRDFKFVFAGLKAMVARREGRA